jgi:hypothetical protein
MRRLIVFACVAAALSCVTAGVAAGKKPHWKGSIKVSGKPSEASLEKMAKVSKADAEKAALAAVKGKDADKTVAEGELEVENGYLIWSFDIKLAGKKGIEEVAIDAGNGKVLAVEHESDQAEAAEKAGEKAPKKGEDPKHKP